jgi:hypothetical protein
MIEHLKKLSPEIIEQYLATREAEPLGIPPKLAAYILQITEASTLHKRHHSISECARILQQSFPELSLPTCKSRIYDAINWLYRDSSVTAESWYLYYADMFMKLFEVNLTAHNFREARTCLQKSCDYRIRASANAIDPDRIRFKPQIISPDIELERMGIKRAGLLLSYKKALSIIDNIDATDAEKQRLVDEVERELNIKDIPHEEVRN